MIVARSFEEASSDIPELPEEAAVISMGSPGSRPPEGFRPSSPRHLRFVCHDINHLPGFVEDSSDYAAPSVQDVGRLIDRAPDLLEAPVVYCHCRAGVSRSTAAAFTLRCIQLGRGSEEEAMRRTLSDRPQARPNRIIVRRADHLLSRQMAMYAQLDHG